MNIFTGIKLWFNNLNTKPLWQKIVTLVVASLVVFWVTVGLIVLSAYFKWLIAVIACAASIVFVAYKAWRK
jgi:hypothetical protein